MATTITVQNIIDAAFAKSAAARPDSMMSPQEFVVRVGQCLQEWFGIMARENPYVLGVVLSVPFNGTGWPCPSDCIKWIKVIADGGTVSTPLLPLGTEIDVCPYDDQGFTSGQASLTELGQVFLPTGQAMDPSGGSVSVVYARAPQLPAQTTDTIDALFPTFLDDFLIYDLAAYMAVKDARKEDETTFLALKSMSLEESIQWSQNRSFGIKQRSAMVTPPLTSRGGGVQRGEQKA